LNQLTLNFGDIALKRVGHGFEAGHKMAWLVENIWAQAGTGILAGPPKTGKTWLIIDLAVSIASGTPFLGKFPSTQGPVIIYSPEGPESCLDDRIRQVAARRGLDHTELEIYTIKAHDLALDVATDQRTIIQAVESIRPALVIFDPLAECFKGDENRSDDVKVATNFLTNLARHHGTASIITHHIVKTAGGKQAGNQMRGSGAWYAFGDSYLFLDPLKNEKIQMKVVQRNGKRADTCILELSEQDSATSYSVTHGQNEEPKKEDLGNLILKQLLKSELPMSQRDLRLRLGGSNGKYNGALTELNKAGLISNIDKVGWELTENGKKTAEDLKGDPVRHSPIGTTRTGPVENP